MTIFDLLFIILFLTTIVTLLVAVVSFFRGRRARALAILLRLAVCAIIYIAIVYAVTAASKQVVAAIGDPMCSDDWCVAVDGAKRTPGNAVTVYDVTLRIFSRARGRAQREGLATDVYLVDSEWRRYNALLKGSEVPLNTLLQPGESVTTGRTFELPPNAHDISLLVGRRPIFPICLIIGECGAFHKEKMVRID